MDDARYLPASVLRRRRNPSGGQHTVAGGTEPEGRGGQSDALPNPPGKPCSEPPDGGWGFCQSGVCRGTDYPLPCRNPHGLRCYAGAGDAAPGEPPVADPLPGRGEERLWDLAKKCGSTVSAISQANHLEGEPEAGRMLLIPAYPNT